MPLLLLLAGGGVLWYLWSTNQIGPVVVAPPAPGSIVLDPTGLTTAGPFNCPGGPNC